MHYYKCHDCAVVLDPSSVWAREISFVRLSRRALLGTRRVGYYCAPCAEARLAKLPRRRQERRR